MESNGPRAPAQRDAITDVVLTGQWANLSPAAKAVYPVIGSLCSLNPNGNRLSLHGISECCGLCRSSVSKAIKELQEKALIAKARGRNGLPNAYAIPAHSDELDLSAWIQRLLPLPGGLSITGDVSIAVDRTGKELLDLIAGLAELLSAQATAKEQEARRIKKKLEIVEYREDVPAPELAEEVGGLHPADGSGRPRPSPNA